MTENTAGDDADAATREGLGMLLGRTVSSYVIITTEPCEPGEPDFPVLAANMELEDARELMSEIVASIDKGKATCISVPDSPEGLDGVLASPLRYHGQGNLHASLGGCARGR